MNGFVVQMRDIDGKNWRRMFLRWQEAQSTVGFIEGPGLPAYGTLNTPDGPALGGRMVIHPTREAAEALLARSLASGQMVGLLDRCAVRPVADVGQDPT